MTKLTGGGARFAHRRWRPGDGGADGDGGEISGQVQAPIPSRPGIKYPVQAPPLNQPLKGL